MKRIIHKKKKHTWSAQIMKELFQRTKEYKYYDVGSRTYPSTFQEEGKAYPYPANGSRMPSPHEQKEDKTTPKIAPTGSSSPKDGSMDKMETALKNTPTESAMEANQGLKNEKEKGNCHNFNPYDLLLYR